MLPRHLVRIKAVFFGLVFVAASCAPSPLEEPSVYAEYGAFRLEATTLLDDAFPNDGPGAAAIVTVGGETVFIGARGLSDLSAGAPIDAETVFRLGSITKQITAAMVMLLVEDGQIELDAPIGRYLIDYPEPGASIPVRNLLNHTSGIPSYTDDPALLVEASSSLERDTDEMLGLFMDSPLQFPPGDEWRYSNSGYVVLGALIEQVTGTAWSTAIEDRMSAPLGLNSLRLDPGEALRPPMAKGYTGRNNIVEDQAMDASFPHAAGGLVANIADLASWVHAFHHGAVLGDDAYAAMTAPTVLNSGAVEGYGFALFVAEDASGRATIGHSGGIYGFSTDSLYFPEEDVFIAVLANSDTPASDPSSVISALADLFFTQESPS